MPCWCRVAPRGAHFVGQRGREFVDEHVLDGDGVGRVIHAEALKLGNGNVGVALGFGRAMPMLKMVRASNCCFF